MLCFLVAIYEEARLFAKGLSTRQYPSNVLHHPTPLLARLASLSAPNITAERNASRSARSQDRGTPDGWHLGAPSVPSAAGSASSTIVSFRPPTCIGPVSR